MADFLPPLRPIPIKERLSILYIEHGRLEVLDGAFVVVDKSGVRTLDGRSGTDKLFGGAGDDVYIVDHAGDQTVETDGNGTDTVRTALSIWTLAANFHAAIRHP